MINIFKRKKTTLESLLSELTLAEQNYHKEQENYRRTERKYLSLKEEYIQAKNIYEKAFSDYVTFGGDANAKIEAQARKDYYNVSIYYTSTTADLNAIKKRVRKAEKVYLRLQKLIAEKEESQPGL